MATEAINKVFPLAEIEALDFAELIESISPIKVGIIRGCSLGIASTAGYVNVAAGQVLIQGRLITVKNGDIFLPVPATDATYHIIVVCDLAASSDTSSAQVMAVTSLNDYGLVAPPVDGFNVSSKKTYAILGHAVRTQTGVSSIGYTYRSPAILNSGVDTRAIAIAANTRSNNNSTAITNNNNTLTTKITAVDNRVTAVNNKVNAIVGLKDAHLVGQTVKISSLAAGSRIGVTCYVKAGETRYPASNAAKATTAEKQNWDNNEIIRNKAATLWQSDYSAGKLETFMGLGEFFVEGTNVGGICLCGWNCVTGSTSEKGQYASLYIKNTGSQAASNIKITVKGLFILKTTLN